MAFIDNGRCSRGNPSEIKVVILGGWYTVKQRPQYIAEMLRRCGCNVKVLTRADIRRRLRYRRNNASADTVTSQIVSPGKFRWLLGGIDASTNLLYEKKFRHIINDADITIVNNLGFWRENWHKVNPIIYDCMDDWLGFGENVRPPYKGHEERQLLQVADVVWVVSDHLLHLIQARYGYTGPIVTIRNGVDLTSYSKAHFADTQNETKPEAIYMGTVGHWFDFELLLDTARLTSDINYKIVGPVDRRAASQIAGRIPQNVEFTGHVPYADIPSLVGSAAVCLIPFKVNSLTKGTNPLKLYEYLAAGKPVVATPMPEVEMHKSFGVVYIAHNANGFAKAVRDAYELSCNPTCIRKRKLLALQNCWEVRLVSMCKTLQELLPPHKGRWLVKKATELLEQKKQVYAQ